MADENRAEVTIGARIDEATQAITELKGKFADFAQSTTNQFGALGTATEALTSHIGGLVTAFLSFEGVRRSVESTKELELGVVALSQKMGIASDEAGALNTALELIGSSGEAYSQMFLKFERSMVSSSDRMKELGVDVDALKSGQKDSNTVFEDAIQHMLDFKVGHEQATYALEVFGRSVSEVYKLLQLNNEVKAKGKALDEALIPVTAQNIQQSKDFRSAMAAISIVTEGFGKVIGDAVMPMLTSFGNWLVEMAPPALEIFRAAINTIVQILDVLYVTVQQIAELFTGFFRVSVVGWTMLGKVINAAFQGDMEGVKSAITIGSQSVSDEWDRMHKRMDQSSADFKARYDARWNPDTTPFKPKGGAGTVPAKGAGAAVAPDTSELDLAIALQKKEFESAKEFLKGEADAKHITGEQKVQLEKEAADKEYSVTRALMLDKANLYKEDDKEYGKALDAVVLLDAQHGVDVQKNMVELQAERKKMHDEEVKLADAAIKHEIDLSREGLKLEEGYLDQQVQMGVITAERKLKIVRDAINSQYEFERAELEREAALIENDKTKVDAYQKALQAIEKLDAAHNIILQKNTNDTLTELGKRWSTMLSTVTTAFETSVKGIIMGTTTLRQAMANIFQSILGEFVSLGVKMVEEWIVQEIKKTAATEAGVAARGAAEEAGSAKSILLWVFTATKNILTSAWEAMAAAFKAMVGIPFIGPAVAPAVAAGVFGTVAGFAGNLSAAGGYDIPQGVNPVVQAHAREMILPAKLSEGVRNMVEGKGGAAGTTVNINAAYADAAGIRRLFMDHGPAMSDAIRRQARNFSPLTPR